MESDCGYTDKWHSHPICLLVLKNVNPEKRGLGLLGEGGGELGGWRKKNVIDSYDTNIHINYYTKHLFFHLLLYAIDHL